MVLSADETGGAEAGTNYGGPAVWKGVRCQTLSCVCFVFVGTIVICRLYKLTLSDQAQPTLQLRVSLSDFV
jgi:hypothetical protein